MKLICFAIILIYSNKQTNKQVNLMDKDCEKELEKLKKHYFTDDLKELKYLFYNNNDLTTTSCFINLRKLVKLTNKHSKLNNYLEEYLKIYNNNINDLDKDNRSALHIACRNVSKNSTEKTIEILIKYGANVNLQTDNGVTSLMYASHLSGTESSEQVVKMLILAGADVNLQSHYGLNALHLSASFTNTNSTNNTVKLLVDAGININLQNYEGQTALHLVCRTLNHFSTIETFNFLIDHCIDVNLQDKDYCTALHYVLTYTRCFCSLNPYNDCLECSKILVKKIILAGADIFNLLDNNGEPAISLFSKELKDYCQIEVKSQTIGIKTGRLTKSAKK